MADEGLRAGGGSVGMITRQAVATGTGLSNLYYRNS